MAERSEEGNPGSSEQYFGTGGENMTNYAQLERQGISFADALSLEMELKRLVPCAADVQIAEVMTLFADMGQKYTDRIYDLQDEIGALEGEADHIEDLNQEIEELGRENQRLAAEVARLEGSKDA